MDECAAVSVSANHLYYCLTLSTAAFSQDTQHLLLRIKECRLLLWGRGQALLDLRDPRAFSLLQADLANIAADQ